MSLRQRKGGGTPPRKRAKHENYDFVRLDRLDTKPTPIAAINIGTIASQGKPGIGGGVGVVVGGGSM